MKNNLLFLFIITLSLHSYSQPQSGIDSVKTFLSQNQYNTAIEFINKSHGNDSKYYKYLGASYKNLFNYSKAIKYYLYALESDSLNYQLNIDLANIFKQIGFNEKALKYFLIADKIHSSILTKVEIASFLVYSDLNIEALKIYSELFRQDTTNTFFIRNIAKCFESLNNIDSAIFYYKKILLIDNFEPFSINRLANLYNRKKDYNKSLILTNEFIEKDSTNCQINRLNSYCFVLLKKYDTAVIKFEKCIKNLDTSFFVYKFIGISYYELEKYDTAKFFLERAYFQDTTDSKTTYFLGLACSNSYYKEKGIYYLNKTLNLMCPSDIELASLYQNIAEAYRGFYKDQEALKYFLRAQLINPNDTLLSFKIGQLYDYSFKNKKMALKYYLDFLSTRPQKKPENNDAKRNQYVLSYYDIIDKRVKWLQEEIKRGN